MIWFVDIINNRRNQKLLKENVYAYKPIKILDLIINLS